MVASFIGVECHFQQYVSYSAEHGGPILLVFNDTLNNVSGITYHMAFSFIGVLRHFQQCLRYNVEHGDQFYWCLMPLSTMCQV